MPQGMEQPFFQWLKTKSASATITHPELKLNIRAKTCGPQLHNVTKILEKKMVGNITTKKYTYHTTSCGVGKHVGKRTQDANKAFNTIKQFKNHSYFC